MTNAINHSGVTTRDLSPGSAGETTTSAHNDVSATDGLYANNFIAAKIRDDIASKHYPDGVRLRFPPEPNGYLHLGHAKAICVNFSLADVFDGACHLRMDDTNPEKESVEYVAGIKDAVSWLGFDWGSNDYRASDYFETMFDIAEAFIDAGLAYVDEEDGEAVRAKRGNFNVPGTDSVYRNRPAAESRARFAEMRAGTVRAGTMLLRARIDMGHPNMNLRDPALVRVKDGVHHALGTSGACPMYDFAHPLSDALEHISHSLCTLEFESHRPLYDWVVHHAHRLGLVTSVPTQIEFARLNLTYTVTSKRLLKSIVDGGYVDGWDDPRMPTLVGARRKGVPAEALRLFCERAGVAKADSVLPIGLIDDCVREILNPRAIRRMAVLDAVPLDIVNRDGDWAEPIMVANHPKDASMGERAVMFGARLWIARDDCRAAPEKGFWRVSPGSIVRLRHAYTIEVTTVNTDGAGVITGVIARIIEGSRDIKGAGVPKAKGNIHWVHRDTGIVCDALEFGHLFKDEKPDMSKELSELLSVDSKTKVSGFAEASVSGLKAGEPVEFERTGYFVRDSVDSSVFNRTCALRSST
jgi:glutaminyl-tRNA synthetase